MANLSNIQLENLRKALLQRESSNNYQAKNKLGYIGGYQVGAATLETLGYLKKGASKLGNKAVNDSTNWTGKGGLKNVNDFLNSPEAQDKIFAENIKFNQRVLKNKGAISDDTSPEDLAGYLAASHLLGAGGASKDLTATDANNVSGAKYFDLGKQAVIASAGGGVDITAPIPMPDLANKEDIKKAQKALGVTADGIWGPKSQTAWEGINELFAPEPDDANPYQLPSPNEQRMQFAQIDPRRVDLAPQEAQYATMEDLLADRDLMGRSLFT